MKYATFWRQNRTHWPLRNYCRLRSSSYLFGPHRLQLESPEIVTNYVTIANNCCAHSFRRAKLKSSALGKLFGAKSATYGFVYTRHDELIARLVFVS